MAVQPISALPTARLSFGRLAAINAFWFGGGAHWQPIYISLIPVGATLIAGSNADLLIGRVTAAGGIFALLTPILVGWLSDRTVTRWGRRRPWMVAGTILNIIGLAVRESTHIYRRLPRRAAKQQCGRGRLHGCDP
jgi:Na+/melibiose symporter-like transporter